MKENPNITRYVSAVHGWIEIGRQRRTLRSLPDHLLKDLGLNRIDVRREGSRHFWDDKCTIDETVRKRGHSAMCRKEPSMPGRKK